jgi:RNA polymerase sigma-70 factor (sigma-E family)
MFHAPEYVYMRRGGDRVRFEDFVGARLAVMTRYALMLTGDPELAQDLTQETMVRASLQWAKVKRADAPEAYVKRMMINLFLDWQRASWAKRVFLRETLEDNVPGPADHAADSANRDVVRAALATLPPTQRAALVLRYYEDLPDQEIADLLGCAVGTVRSHISRALAHLRTVEPALGGTR